MRKLLTPLSICLLTMTLYGCGKSDGLDGKTYHPASGGPTMTIDFKDGKAKVDIGGATKTLDYKVDGDTVTIINKEEGDIVLTKHPDGSLTSVLGVLYPSK